MTNHAYMFMQKYLCLASAAVREGRPNYKIRPKFHELHHILHDLDEGSRINPRLLANWANETSVARLTNTSKSTHPASVGRRVLERWLVELQVRLDAQTSSPKVSSMKANAACSPIYFDLRLLYTIPIEIMISIQVLHLHRCEFCQRTANYFSLNLLLSLACPRRGKIRPCGVRGN